MEIPSASYCGRCHADVHTQWRESAHANSFRTPWYVKNVNQLTGEKGIEYTRHCEGCHNPSALFTGALTTGSAVPRPHDEDGVTCMTCHSIKRIQSTRGTGSYVMGKPAVLVDDAGQPVPGLPGDADILAHLDRHKQAVMQPLYRSAEFCSVCHKAAIPASLNGYKWLRTFSTWDEWQQSSWSKETPLPFYSKPSQSTCQSCHMHSEPASDPAAKSGMVASHRWLGANTGVPMQYGFTEQARRVAEYLKDNQIEIDIFGLTVEHTAAQSVFEPARLVAPLGQRSFTLIPGDWVRVDVVVRNKGIGHTLAPELRDFYENWLDFEAKDDLGNTLYRSGAVSSKGEVDPQSRSYTTRIISRDGQGIDHHEVWKIQARAYDATISPGRSDVVRYRFRVPSIGNGFRVTASLRYRRFNRRFSDWVFDDKAGSPERFPTVTLATGNFHFTIGDNHGTAVGTSAMEREANLLRWNNYGIGMLDRQQFAEASDAFRHVVSSDPMYQRGYVNVAIAEYSRGRYDEALSWIDRGEVMDAADSRAEYYRGLCLRWQGHIEEAIRVLKPVAAKFPRFITTTKGEGYTRVCPFWG